MSDAKQKSDRQSEPQSDLPRPQDGSAKVHGDVLEPLIPREADQKASGEGPARGAEEGQPS